MSKVHSLEGTPKTDRATRCPMVEEKHMNKYVSIRSERSTSACLRTHLIEVLQGHGCVYGIEPIDFIVENRKTYYECEMLVAWLRILLKMKCSALGAPTDGNIHSALFDAGVLVPISAIQKKPNRIQFNTFYVAV